MMAVLNSVNTHEKKKRKKEKKGDDGSKKNRNECKDTIFEFRQAAAAAISE